MSWSLPIGRIFGIELRVHVTFLFLVVWIAILQGAQAHDLMRGISTVAILLMVFGCVLLHELGHAMAARRYGIRTRDIVLLPIGGIARLERMPEHPGQEIVVALAGPAVNVVIAGLLWLLAGPIRSNPTDLDFGGTALSTLFGVNVLMLLFNLIPAFPMDGGRVLRGLLALRMSHTRATRIAAGVGQTFALLFGIVGLFGLPGLLPPQPMLVFVALFVFLAAGEERALVETRSTLSGVHVREAMLTDFRIVNADDPLSRAVEHLMAGSQQDFPVLDEGRPIGILTRADLVLALQRGGVDQRIRDAMKPVDPLADVREPLESALQRMRERGQSSAPVIEQGRLVGLLTVENISDLLVVRGALQRHARTAQAG